MVKFSTLLVGACAVVGAAAGPLEVFRRASYYSSYWNDNKGEKVTYKNGKDGQYSCKWSGKDGNFVAGKGWNTGSDK